MQPDQSGDRGPDAGGRPAAPRSAGSSPRLTLELVIDGSDPLCGTVGPAGGQHQHAFVGWIDLMSVIGSLCAPEPAAPEPAAPGSAAPGSAAPEPAAPEPAAPGSAAPGSAAPESAAPESAEPESAEPGSAAPDLGR
jgi:hypothetical protein